MVVSSSINANIFHVIIDLIYRTKSFYTIEQIAYLIKISMH